MTTKDDAFGSGVWAKCIILGQDGWTGRLPAQAMTASMS